MEETITFVAGSHEPDAEAAKLNRDRVLFPGLAVGVMTGAVGGLVAAVLAVLRLVGATP